MTGTRPDGLHMKWEETVDSSCILGHGASRWYGGPNKQPFCL